jgi:uncharacterized YigZ family protein
MADEAAYRVPLSRSRSELREKGSRFLAIVEPAGDESAVRQQLLRYRQQYHDATHVCWAWRVGSPAVEGRSDAGEPAGTAGTPMLQVLRAADLSDVLAVVVRWYGGVKLGKGGLVRAYRSVVRAAVADLRSEMRRTMARLRLRLPYERVGDLKRLIHPPLVEMVEETYGDDVEIVLEVEQRYLEEIEEATSLFAVRVEDAGT